MTASRPASLASDDHAGGLGLEILGDSFLGALATHAAVLHAAERRGRTRRVDIVDTDDAEIQALYSRAIAPFWDVQAGLRYDIEPDGVAHGVVALNGLAPYWFEVDASAFLSERGDLTARVEAEYELLLTQRLILQPRIEANLSAQDIPERETGSGLNSIDAGLRLRYEIKREFAPYIGVEWQSAFGDTRDLINAAGGDGDEVVFLVGLRTWY